jgi:hypothetical protein
MTKPRGGARAPGTGLQLADEREAVSLGVEQERGDVTTLPFAARGEAGRA